MDIERHETGPRMSKVVIHGDTVYLAGIVADNPKGKSVAEQTRSTTCRHCIVCGSDWSASGPASSIKFAPSCWSEAWPFARAYGSCALSCRAS